MRLEVGGPLRPNFRERGSLKNVSRSNEPRLSVVIPLLNEEENVLPLIEALRSALDEGGERERERGSENEASHGHAPGLGCSGTTDDWELILVDDGSDDQTGFLVTAEARDDPRIRLVSLVRRYGQSTAMQVGFDRARGEVVVTMDGDLQYDPRDIRRLLEVVEEGFDLVAGYRENRQDPFLTRKVPSWIANRIIAWITRVPIRDNGCSLKAYRRDLLDRMRLYSDMHRFIPALAAGVAGARIAEVPVRHYPRTRGESKYGLSRVGKVLADLLAVKMIRSFRSRPLRMFGGGASLAFLASVLFAVAAVAFPEGIEGRGSPSVVFAGVSMLCFSLALFLLMLGLIGEVAVDEKYRRAPDRPPLLREVRI